LRFINEPTAVEARFEIAGTVRPRRFTWGRSWLDVSDVGRQWMNQDGRHVLVMTQASRSGEKWTPGGQHVFELLLERESLTWRVVRAPDRLMAA